MIWIICAILTVLLLALSIKASLNKKRGSLRILFVLAFLFAATYVSYLPVFVHSYDLMAALVGNLSHVLQVATSDVGLMECYDVVRAGIPMPPLSALYMVMLGTIHIAMPAVSALSAVTVLFRCFSSIRLLIANRRSKPMFVFSEMNEAALQLTKSLAGMRCSIVFANCAPGTLGNEDDSKPGFVFKEESISELKVRCSKRKDVYFFCISENEDDSLSYALQLIEKFSALEEEVQEHVHIFQFSKHEDFSVFIDSADKGMLDVQCVNEYEMLIYNLLNKYPLYRYADGHIHVLLHGLSAVNVVALRAIAWCAQLGGYTARISVVGVGIEQQINDLKVSVPGLFTERYDVRFYNCGSENEIVDTIRVHCADANYIIVSEDSDNDTMNRGILLRRLFYKLDPTFQNCPPIFCYVKEASKYNIVSRLATAEANPKRKMSYDLIPFGKLSEIYTYENLVDSDIEKLAKNVHLAYEEIFSDGPIDVKGALKRFNVFEVNKRSNRAAALHIRYKLNLLGLDYTDTAGESVDMGDYYTDEFMETLARAEHDRWMAFLETEGWTPSTHDEVYAYRGSEISKGRHNCPLLKMHPYICGYDDLKDLSLDLEGKDTTIYDKALILKIPDILADKWGVSGKKYRIVKR